MYLTKLDEKRVEVIEKINKHQEYMKIFDKRTKQRKFVIGDSILPWDRRREPKGAHKKFDSLWKHPFVIRSIMGENVFHMAYLVGTPLPLAYNG